MHTPQRLDREYLKTKITLSVALATAQVCDSRMWPAATVWDGSVVECDHRGSCGWIDKVPGMTSVTMDYVQKVGGILLLSMTRISFRAWTNSHEYPKVFNLTKMHGVLIMPEGATWFTCIILI